MAFWIRPSPASSPFFVLDVQAQSLYLILYNEIQSLFQMKQIVLMLACWLAAAVPLSAVTTTVSLTDVEATLVDGTGENVNYADASTFKIVENGIQEGSRKPGSCLLLHLPEALFSLYDPTLSTCAELTLTACADKNLGDATLRLHPLTTPFVLGEATWNNASTNVAWTTPGGDFMSGTFVDAARPDYDAKGYAFRFDLLPLLRDGTAREALASCGALVCIPEGTAAAEGFVRVNLDNPAQKSEAKPYEVFAALRDPWTENHAFGVSYIDSDPRAKKLKIAYADPTTVIWEQDYSTVGKVLLNANYPDDLSECRAIVSIPAALAALPPWRVQRLTAEFDAEINEYDGEDIFLLPIDSPTVLELNDPDREPDPFFPDHGPSWAWADGAVSTTGTVAEGIPWSVPNQLNTNGGFTGPWASDWSVKAVVTAPTGTQTHGTAVFDLTALWQNGDAREFFVRNGAMVVMDPARWPEAIADKRCPRVNLYRPDWEAYDSHVTLVERESLPGVRTAYIDSADPDANFSTGGTLKTLLDSNGSECRSLFRLPEGIASLDLKQAGQVKLFLVTFRKPGSAYVPALHPLLRAFDPASVTWNSPWENPGGDFAGTFAPGTFESNGATCAFDIAPLLADADLAGALAGNGAILRLIGEFPASGSAMLNGNSSSYKNESLRPIVVAFPAELATTAFSASADSLSFEISGLDPAADYAIYSTTNLSDTNSWTYLQSVPRNGSVVIPLPGDSAVSYRIQRQ